MRRLTPEEVHEIRRMWRNGFRGYGASKIKSTYGKARELAHRYGVSRMTIWRVVNNRVHRSKRI